MNIQREGVKLKLPLRHLLLSCAAPKRLRLIGLWMIIAGLVADAAVIVFVPSGGFEKFLSVLSTLVIALGVWIEGVGAEATEAKEKAEAELRLDALNAQAAEANREAATARSQLGQLSEWLRRQVGPRMIDYDSFMDALKGIPPQQVRIIFLRDAPDGVTLATSFMAHLLSAGWTVEDMSPIEAPPPGSTLSKVPLTMAVGGQPSGVSVVARSLERLPVRALMNAIMRSLGVAAGGADETMPDDLIRIVIGPKP